MQSNGGLMTGRGGRGAAGAHHRVGPGGRRRRRPGAGAADRARPSRSPFDMGGTTAKAVAGRGRRGDAAPREYQVGGGIMVGSRLLTGAGYPLRVPAIDLAEVGAGGGSHRLARRRRRAAGRPRERRRLSRARSATTSAAPSPRSPMPTSCSATSTRTRWPAARVPLDAAACARRHRRQQVAAPLGLRARGGGAWRAPDRGLEHDPRDPGGLERARPRPARLRAVRLRRQRPAVRGWDGAGARDDARGGAAGAPGVFSAFGLLASRCRAPSIARPGGALARGLDPAALASRASALRPRRAPSWPPRASRRAAVEHPARRDPALPGPVLRAARSGFDAAEPARLEEAFGARARAHLRPSRRCRGAGRDRQPAGDRHRPAGPPAHAGPPVAARLAPRSPRAPPISAARSAGARRPCIARAALATPQAGPARSSRNTTAPAWCRPARPRRSTASATSSSTSRGSLPHETPASWRRRGAALNATASAQSVPAGRRSAWSR